MESSSNKAPLESIEAILRLEKDNERGLALHHRLLHAIGGFVGTAQFVVLQCVAVAAWIAFNSSDRDHAIDEFPYPLLATFLSLEAVLLTSCVLIRQGLIDRTLERRDHLELQINLLAEREATRSLRILQALAAKLQVATGECEPDELTSDTSINQIARELQAREEGDTDKEHH